MPAELLDQLVSLRRTLLTMGAISEQRVNQALDALINFDKTLAEEVRAKDDDLDEMEVDIEAECLRILALHHPVARDLRFVLAAIRINADLERLGDLAKGISKRLLLIPEGEQIPNPPALAEMADAVRKILADSLKSLSEDDAELASAVRRADEYIDDKQREMFTWAEAEIPEHVATAQSVIHMLFAVRSIERIADLATNIAEDVIFYVEGSIVRHTPVS